MNNKELIENGKAILGIELGSTRIKAVLIDNENQVIATGDYNWENKLVDGIWTYSLDDVWTGLQQCYQNLLKTVQNTYNCSITNFAAIGISGMMHGYMPFDKGGNLLSNFRTWRNTCSEEASEKLTKLFNYHIPQRWSIAHFYQSMLNCESHVDKVKTLLTLSAYVHWQLTGEKVVGIGDASGMFPIDSSTKSYNQKMINQFNAIAKESGYDVDLNSILPKIMLAGEFAGCLSEEGAKRLDISGNLKSGIKMAPPEGDAGTGMVATNSVGVRTGNISAGTSIFGMVVLEKELSKVYEQLDLVTTPFGDLVAMSHCNNCTSDLDAWVGVFKEFSDEIGAEMSISQIYSVLYNKALEGDFDCGGNLSYNYLSGEHMTGMPEGRPLFVRTPTSKFNLANFMRMHLYSCVAVLKIGLDVLLKEEHAKLDMVYGHGGLFKTKGVAHKFIASALNTSVYVMETAGEGGAWGMAVLASYMIHKNSNESLADYLSNKVFKYNHGNCIEPNDEEVKGFEDFMEMYLKGLPIEKSAIDNLSCR